MNKNRTKFVMTALLLSASILSGVFAGRMWAQTPVCKINVDGGPCGRYKSHKCMMAPCENCNTAPSYCINEYCSACGTHGCKSGQARECPVSTGACDLNQAVLCLNACS